MRTLYLTSVLCVASASMLACGGDDDNGDTNKPDSGVHVDGGTKADAGPSSSLDGGSMDSGLGDAGHEAVDAGPNYADAAAGTVIATSKGAWVVFTDPYGNGMPNPAQGITGSATATADGEGGTTVQLIVRNVEANRNWGAHLHVLTCEEMMAGGHYENSLAADGGTDPSKTNEVWLDFHTDETGGSTVKTTVNWVPRHGQANAIVVHNMFTNDSTGVAGPKLACLNLPF